MTTHCDSDEFENPLYSRHLSFLGKFTATKNADERSDAVLVLLNNRD